MHAVTTRTIRDHFRSHLRRQTVIAVLVTRDATARDAELFRQRHAFMAVRAAISSHRRRRLLRIPVEGLNDVVYSVTVRAHRRARHAADDGLAVDALNEFVGLGAMTLAAGIRNVDLGD